ncbi:MAG: hypothetical protein ACREUW_04510 [Burkholderiales bacterium]
MRRFLACCGVVILLASCSVPDTNVRTGSPRPALVIKGAPMGAIIVVDGLEVGVSEQYDGNPGALVVEEGVHVVEVRRAGQVIHSERIFISNGETRTITVILATR